MQHPTGGTTMRIDDNVPRSCIYNDRRDGYGAGDREARYPHLSRGDTRYSCQQEMDWVRPQQRITAEVPILAGR